VLIIPFSSAARNATSTLLLFKLLGLSQAYLASLLVLVVSLFPLTYPWVVTIPWVLAHMLTGHLGRGSCLFAGMYAARVPYTHARTRTQMHTHTHAHAHAHAHTHARTRTHARMHMHTYMHMQACCSRVSTRQRRSSAWSAPSG
jgi:hypothetical protein